MSMAAYQVCFRSEAILQFTSSILIKCLHLKHVKFESETRFLAICAQLLDTTDKRIASTYILSGLCISDNEVGEVNRCGAWSLHFLFLCAKRGEGGATWETLVNI